MMSKKVLFHFAMGFLASVGVWLVGGVAPSFGQVDILSEDFDPLSAGQVLQVGYSFGDTTSSSSGIGSGAGVTGDSWQTVNTTSANGNGFSGVGAQYQHGTTTGNVSTNLSDYVLSFDAKADGGSLLINIETWVGPGFTGGMTGSLRTAPAAGFGNDVPLSANYTHYDLDLSNTTTFMTNTGIDMTGDTIQITFQFNGSGAAPFTQTLDVDNLTLTMAIPEPTSIVLLGLALPAIALAARRRR